MLDHVSLGTTDLARAAAFYDALLAPLGVVRVWAFPDAVGYGPRATSASSLGEGDALPIAGLQPPGGGDRLAIKLRAGASPPGPGFHLAFTARSRAEVDAAFAAALAHGGTSDGPPGLRERYGPGYYTAFLVDPDGHRVEVVVHEPVG